LWKEITNNKPLLQLKHERVVSNIEIRGKVTDEQTRCVHYHSDLDIIAIKFKCCNTYYPCIHCHDEEAQHKSEVWKKDEFKVKAVLCGNCKTELSINDYLSCNAVCPSCSALFNPRCSNHHHYYFEV
jgi:uncharacterized CHY-type Zn-finger protein